VSIYAPGAAADPSASICAYLLNTMGDLVEGRIFRPDLPKSEDQYMPRACLLVRAAGGYKLFGGGYMPVGDPLIHVIAYGVSAQEAASLSRSVYIALKQLTPGVWENTHLRWARIAMGPTPDFDDNVLWPLSVVSAQVMCTDVQVPS
jgi:hypothetical protein